MFVFAIRKNHHRFHHQHQHHPTIKTKHTNKHFIDPSSHESQDQNESAAILKIKESMQEEAKRFEKDSDPPDYFMQ